MMDSYIECRFYLSEIENTLFFAGISLSRECLIDIFRLNMQENPFIFINYGDFDIFINYCLENDLNNLLKEAIISLVKYLSSLEDSDSILKLYYYCKANGLAFNEYFPTELVALLVEAVIISINSPFITCSHNKYQFTDSDLNIKLYLVAIELLEDIRSLNLPLRLKSTKLKYLNSFLTALEILEEQMLVDLINRNGFFRLKYDVSKYRFGLESDTEIENISRVVNNFKNLRSLMLGGEGDFSIEILSRLSRLASRIGAYVETGELDYPVFEFNFFKRILHNNDFVTLIKSHQGCISLEPKKYIANLNKARANPFNSLGLFISDSDLSTITSSVLCPILIHALLQKSVIQFSFIPLYRIGGLDESFIGRKISLLLI